MTTAHPRASVPLELAPRDLPPSSLPPSLPLPLSLPLPPFLPSLSPSLTQPTLRCSLSISCELSPGEAAGAQHPGQARRRVPKPRRGAGSLDSGFQLGWLHEGRTLTSCLHHCACSFDPPGPMSAGMSCEVLVTFKPMVSVEPNTKPWKRGFSHPVARGWWVESGSLLPARLRRVL